KLAVPATSPLEALSAMPIEPARVRAHPMMRLQQGLGNQAVQRMVKASLAIAAPQTDLEREADAASEQAIATDPTIRPPISHSVAPSGTDSVDVSALPEAPPIVESVLRSPGAPLEPSTRGAMEESLGYDFGGVRIHTDAEAAASAHAIGAHAYTVGSEVVFGAGRYNPA